MNTVKTALQIGLMLFVVGAARPVAAQNMTSVDVERLQDAITDATRDVSSLQSRDAALASQLQKELEGLHDESIYLRVKMRKNEAVPRTEYFALRDQIDTVRSRARREGPSAASPPAAPAARPAASSMDVPVGTELDVRLTGSLSSSTALVEDRVEATTLVDVQSGARTIVPAGSVLRGLVSSVTRATRVERKGALTLVFDQVTIGGRAYPIRATVTQALESAGVRGEASKIGAGAGVGAIIGGILGGFKGAMAGILIGGGGTIAATDGKDVELAAGTVLRIRLDSGLDLR
ncbi:MAG: hypothetical protein ABL961_01250 [Vicinamibacterales bacterium]